jgi:hypothetical protein
VAIAARVGIGEPQRFGQPVNTAFEFHDHVGLTGLGTRQFLGLGEGADRTVGGTPIAVVAVGGNDDPHDRRVRCLRGRDDEQRPDEGGGRRDDCGDQRADAWMHGCFTFPEGRVRSGNPVGRPLTQCHRLITRIGNT